MSSSNRPGTASGAANRRSSRPVRKVHMQLAEEQQRRDQLLASKRDSRRALAAANAECRQERRAEMRLVKKASKYDLDTFVKICGKKTDLPFIVCSRCNCPIDSRLAIRKAVAEVRAGRPTNLQDAGLPLLDDAAAAKEALSMLCPATASEQRPTADEDAATD